MATGPHQRVFATDTDGGVTAASLPPCDKSQKGKGHEVLALLVPSVEQ